MQGIAEGTGFRIFAAGMLMVLCLVPAPRAAAQKVLLGEEAYLQPPEVILESVTAPWHQNVTLSDLSPDGRKYLVTLDDGMTPLALMSRPYVTLGESSFDHVAHRSRRLTTGAPTGYEIHYHEDGRIVKVELPERVRVSGAKWSPDGSKLAFFGHAPEATHLYVADTGNGRSRRLSDRPVLATHETSLKWTQDGRRLQTVLLPADAKRPERTDVATEPKVRIARDGKTPTRTYRFLLETPYDMQLLEYLSTGQLCLVDVANGRVTEVGEPQMVTSVNMDPAGKHFRVRTMLKPFSYFAPASQFGSQEVLMDMDGKAVHTFYTRELRDPAADGQTRTRAPADDASDAKPGDEPKRDVRWRPDGTGISYLQREPAKKDAEKKADDAKPAPDDTATPPDDAASAPKADERARKDRVMWWKPPYGEEDIEVLYESEQPISQVQYSEDCGTLFITQTIDRRRTIYAVDLKEPETKLILLQSDPQEGGGESGAPAGRGPGRRTVRPGTTPSPRPDGDAAVQKDDKAQGTQDAIDQKKAQATKAKGAKKSNAQVKPPAQKTADDKKAAGKQAAGKKADKKAAAGQDAKKKVPDKKGDDPAGDDAKKPDDDAAAGAGPEPTRGVKTGTLMTRAAASGEPVVRMSSQGDVYFQGADERKDPPLPPLPSIDKVNIRTGEVSRVFVGKSDLSESIVSVWGDDLKYVFTTRENASTVPDSFSWNVSTGEEKRLTENKNYAPWYQKLEVENFQVERVDGFKFSVRTYRNPDYGQKLPAILWFYPREYTDQANYDSRNRSRPGSPQSRFARPSTRSMTHLTQIGYVVVEPDLPIVGPEGRMNDNYVADLRNGLWAVIDALDKRGLVDRDRLAIGGHSYGAFSAANAMAHTPFFKAGIAGDGNYNRTLTPMAFQTERRYVWDAREVYLQMSPLLWANQVNGALLMYHGMDDANTGTFPINSDRMFQALDGLGKPSALYMYPYEGHGPAAQETILDMWARWVEWLDVYVRQHGRKPAEAHGAESAGDAAAGDG